MPVCEEKYIKANVREFNGVVQTNFLGDKISKEDVFACITGITIDSVMRMKKMNFPRVHLEEYKYKIKKIKLFKFKNTEIQSESESDLQSDTELEPMLEFILARLGFFRVAFSGGEVQFDPPSYFKKNLSNINVTLYNCLLIYLKYAEGEKKLTSSVIC